MNGFSSLSVAAARRNDALCDEFEQTLIAGQSPAIESFLVGLPSSECQKLLVDLMGLEVDHRIARGERLVPSEYAIRFPELPASTITTLFEQAFRGEDALLGQTIHIYQCVSLLGAGAMGRVYLVRHEQLQRHCALKILSPKRGVCDAEYVERFLREGQAAAALVHPNIVTLHAVGQIENTHFLEMEYIPGRSLQQLIREEGPFPVDRALRLATMVADGLAAAHRAGIVHRDVKPDNVMITRMDIAKIGDFGLAFRKLSVDDEDSAGMICGTPNYMAPELFLGQDASTASDVYALGLCLYQMLIGRLPWRQTSFSELAQHGRTEAVPNVRDLRPELSLELANCVAMLTAADPGQRPIDATVALLQLRAVQGLERGIESLLLEAFGHDTTVSWTRDQANYCVTRQLPGHREQTVFLDSSQSTEDQPLLLLYSICGRATPEFYEQALMQNAVVMHGSMAIRMINDIPMFVVINAYPRSTVSPEEIRVSVQEIAMHADHFELLLTRSAHG